MLVEFSVQNFASFNTRQTFSLVASSSTKENFNEQNTITVNKFGIDKLLKSAALFGANAGGKSNFIRSFHTFRQIVLRSLPSAEENLLDSVSPFLIKDISFDIPTEFEVIFIHEEKLYRYGIAIENSKISEEWLFWINQSRETSLFQRNKQEVTINKRSFSEAKDFIKEEKGKLYVEKTRDTVPFVSVLSQFNGEKSQKIIEWFKKVHIISGISEMGYEKFSIKLLEEDPKFKAWALDILSSLQIHNIVITDSSFKIPFENLATDEDEGLGHLVDTLRAFMKKKNPKGYEVEIERRRDDSESLYVTPLSMESAGTKKLIFLLGPLYDIIKSGKILFVDEFDNKFHSLLSKFILEVYHKKNRNNSQMIITCHDTNLLTSQLFRRDQIWFVEKNDLHESELYSLLEYKEHYTRKDDSYGKDYLLGKYGAIPLFASIDKLTEALNG